MNFFEHQDWLRATLPGPGTPAHSWIPRAWHIVGAQWIRVMEWSEECKFIVHLLKERKAYGIATFFTCLWFHVNMRRRYEKWMKWSRNIWSKRCRYILENQSLWRCIFPLSWNYLEEEWMEGRKEGGREGGKEKTHVLTSHKKVVY